MPKRVPDIEINPGARPRVHSLGSTHHCIVVDDFLVNPASVRDYAAECASEFRQPPKSYPGHVMALDPQDTTTLRRYIRSQMSRHFPFLRGGLGLTTLLSVTTFKPGELTNLQRLCHTDPRTAANRDNYAAVVYLFDDERLGGTGFYRWKNRAIVEQATALEQSDPDAATALLREHCTAFRQTPDYLTESNELAELIDVVPARFNRWIFYSGDIPHSAHITEPESLSTDFARGRLTLNCFASVRPSHRAV